jgi:hypothetical protein
MKTIYVITQGCYSDYSIDTIFATKEQAEAYLAVELKLESLSKGQYESQYTIEEHQLYEPGDQVKPIKDTLVPAVLYELDLLYGIQDCNAQRITEWVFYKAISEKDTIRRVYKKSCKKVHDGYNRFTHNIKVQSLISMDHARKVAFEYRQEHLRCEGLGLPFNIEELEID